MTSFTPKQKVTVVSVKAHTGEVASYKHSTILEDRGDSYVVRLGGFVGTHIIAKRKINKDLFGLHIWPQDNLAPVKLDNLISQINRHFYRHAVAA